MLVILWAMHGHPVFKNVEEYFYSCGNQINVGLLISILFSLLIYEQEMIPCLTGLPFKKAWKTEFYDSFKLRRAGLMEASAVLLPRICNKLIPCQSFRFFIFDFTCITLRYGVVRIFFFFKFCLLQVGQEHGGKNTLETGMDINLLNQFINPAKLLSYDRQ